MPRKVDTGETIREAATWENVKGHAFRYGLCHVCAAQLAWGHQIGFAVIEREPCDECRPLIAALPRTTGHPAWRTVAGRASRPGPWTTTTGHPGIGGPPPPGDDTEGETPRHA
jgi:hypothetical protein